MKDFDFEKLDGQLLKTFLLILEENSVSMAAERLDVNQSTVSHSLNKLRRILGDPLFVRSGQGLTPTETALALKAPVLEVLDKLQSLTDLRPFDPKSEKMHFVAAANDMQRDLIFPHLLRQAWADNIALTMELRPSGVPSVGLLRDARCDLILTPLPPDAPDLMQLKLFTGEMHVFYDPACRDAPKSLDDYVQSDHVSVHFALGGSSDEVIVSRDLQAPPKPKVTVSNFAGLPAFIRGTELLTTQLKLMGKALLQSLASAPIPFEIEPVSVYMVWHQRSTNDPAHRWLREQITEISRKTMV
ncbi:LysR family transcriptional regulator [Cognatishimia sp. D5M38]|uniref:LysR family transcriptional regulator n=1 Tax=Cognatishimia coralii TaxID=3083254 RepID=A0ABU8QI99_9RHOB